MRNTRMVAANALRGMIYTLENFPHTADYTEWDNVTVAEARNILAKARELSELLEPVMEAPRLDEWPQNLQWLKDRETEGFTIKTVKGFIPWEWLKDGEAWDDVVFFGNTVDRVITIHGFEGDALSGETKYTLYHMFGKGKPYEAAEFVIKNHVNHCGGWYIKAEWNPLTGIV